MMTMTSFSVQCGKIGRAVFVGSLTPLFFFFAARLGFFFLFAPCFTVALGVALGVGLGVAGLGKMTRPGGGGGKFPLRVVVGAGEVVGAVVVGPAVEVG
jgi:hypothetical protein